MGSTSDDLRQADAGHRESGNEGGALHLTTEDRPATKPDAVPQIAGVESLSSRPIRMVVVTVVLVAVIGYASLGTVLARNVTFNISDSVDPGAYNGIRRYTRETIMSVWRTMWDRAPEFGSIDMTRMVLLISTIVFFVAFATIIVTVFVPSRREWLSGLEDDQTRDASPGG